MSALTVVDQREWELFSDWCHSIDVDPRFAGVTIIETFLAEIPVAPGTAKRRVTAIRRSLEQTGVHLDLPAPPRSSTVRSGEGWATVSEALLQLPKWRYPTGLRGRRDAWILVLIAVLGMSRREAAAVTPADVEIGGGVVRISGRLVPRSDRTADCPACAVARWLDVIGRAHYGWRSDLRTVLMPPEAPPNDHSCETELSTLWMDVPALTATIDTHGWVHTGRGIGLLSVSKIMDRTQRLTGEREAAIRQRVVSERFAEASVNELADAYDDVDARLAELLAQAESLLEESRGVLGALAGGSPENDEGGNSEE
ncbi:hypothetical protein ACFVAJ_16780 [Agromyces sp. NPDC057679]|uniref:hypothetical protein n=1 Tax=Agromyces sp. NPDC057679 TaxID=3346207 RepID=UPI00366FA2F3